MNVVIGLVVGFGIGVVAWMISSHWIAVLLNNVEDRKPALVGTRTLRMYEAVVCVAVFLGCLALALWLSWLVWMQVK